MVKLIAYIHEALHSVAGHTKKPDLVSVLIRSSFSDAYSIVRTPQNVREHY
jgi:hypothetical protein